MLRTGTGIVAASGGNSRTESRAAIGIAAVRELKTGDETGAAFS